MSTTSIPVVTTSITGDTNANPNTLVQRDSQGGITGNVVSATSLETSGNYSGVVVTKTTSFTAGAATDYLCDATSGNITVTLPLASAYSGTVYWFTKKDSSGNTISISSVDGTGSISTQYAHLRVISDGTSWYSA